MPAHRERARRVAAPIFLLYLCGVAQESRSEEPDTTVEEVIVTGTRRGNLALEDSPVPIDVFRSEELTKAGSTDMNDALRTLVPSFNIQRFPISDGSTFVRPATLRGLPPDETLVLINSKRRHRSALVQLGSGEMSQGAQGPDLAQIPTIAIKQVEVLRDGASAQYGSDAIAGVINFILKDNASGLNFSTQTGRYFAGDGEDIKISGNIGMQLTPAGFFNFSAEYLDVDRTSRGVQRADAQELIDSGEPYESTVPRPAQLWGSPESKGARTFWNSGLDLGGSRSLYAFGNYSSVEQGGSFYYRHPVTGTVFAPLPRDPTDPSQGNFTYAEIFPGGFTPWFTADVTDFSQVLGLRGEFGPGIQWDASGSYGRSKLDYHLANTVNPSLGLESPREFEPGALTQTEQNLNLDGSYAWDTGLLFSPINVAAGLEYRKEDYEIGVGDPLSWEIGPYARLADANGNPLINPATGAPYSGMPVGSNGFPGYDPTQAGSFSRDNTAVYIDLEGDVTSRLFVGIAGRYEDFSDFGNTTNGKLSVLLKVLPDLSLRGAVSTGFRAPTPGQSHTTNIATAFDPGNPNPIARGTIPPTNPIAEFFGAKPLQPEESDNLSVGVVATLFDKLLITVDAYQIKVKDRIALSGNIEIDAETAAQLEASGIPGASSFGTIAFFTNDFDTTTRGIDVVARTDFDLGQWGSTTLSAAFNRGYTQIDSFSPEIITRERGLDLQNQVPKNRGSFTVNHTRGPVSLMVRTSYYGEFMDAGPELDGSTDEAYGGEWLVDLEAAYTFKEHYELTVGGSNIFDNYPDASRLNRIFGMVYPVVSPFGFDGGYWFARLTARFD